jgi:hypothetical protein
MLLAKALQLNPQSLWVSLITQQQSQRPRQNGNLQRAGRILDEFLRVDQSSRTV